jgi:hypothetical protein
MKKILFSFFALCVATNLWAYDFKSGSLYYNITNNVEPYTVAVTKERYPEYGASPKYNYKGLVSAIIPEFVTHNGITYQVTSIEDDTFSGAGLKSITIPNSVKNVGNAFDGGSIQEIIFLSSVPPSVSTAVYSNAYYLLTCAGIKTSPICYIPCGSKDAYEKSAWRHASDLFIEDVEFTLNLSSSNISQGVAKVVAEESCKYIVISAIPTDGYVFVKWSDGNTQATRNIELTENINLVAYFAPKGHIINVYQDCTVTIE